MKANCRTCGFEFDSFNISKPFCPRCGFDVVDVETQTIRVHAPEAGPIPAIAVPDRGDARVHEIASSETVEVVCVNGHRWSERVDAANDDACPHGTDKGKSVQVELVCRCGKTLSVVGEVGKPSCPSCGRRMTCPKCKAAKRDEPPRDVRCPRCGKRPVNVPDAPDIEIGGDVHKKISARRRH